MLKIIERLVEDIDHDIENQNKKIGDLTIQKGEELKSKKDTAQTDADLTKENEKLAELQLKKAKEATK